MGSSVGHLCPPVFCQDYSFGFSGVELRFEIVCLAGYMVYHGPRESVLDFFEPLGFRCPERKGIADFLQEVTSHKDQQVSCTCR